MPPVSHLAAAAVVLLIAVEGISHLDCDFRTECCWAGDGGWSIKEKHSFNINEFRRTFLVGRSKNPPAGNYVIRESFGESGEFYSCPFCSADGAVMVQFRHWQSPTARLRVCYKIAEQDNNKECQMASAAKQSRINSFLFRVPRAQKLQLLFLTETTQASMSSKLIIDSINVQFLDCHSRHISHSAPSTAIPPRPSKKKIIVQAANKTLEVASAKRNQQLTEAVYKRFHKKNGTARVSTLNQNSANPQSIAIKAKPLSSFPPPDKKGTVKPSIPPPAPAPQRPPIALPPAVATSGKDFNPLNDLLGENLANFLDPNYVTDDKEEPEGEETEDFNDGDLIGSHTATHNIDDRTPTAITPALRIPPKIVLPKVPVKVNKPAPLSELQRPLPLGVPGNCETVGGCLFERGYCSWKAPADVPVNSQFKLTRVGPSTFLQAKVPPREVSIIQVDTQMRENHTIVFDALEWQTGSRLIGCCFVNMNLHCPFATPNEQGAILWQISKYECPAGTDKILFICENFGTEDAICGVDNVRLHRSMDIFFIEPCQKQLLSSF